MAISRIHFFLFHQDLTDLIPLFYDHVELAEDRSLKIPSISDDGEVQLDPKRHTAMSSFGVSSQADFYSGNPVNKLKV